MKPTKSIQNGSIIESITEREREIIRLIAQHHTNKEIAESLHLALSTVKWYTRQIFNKLTVNSRREAIERANVLGLLKTETSKAIIPNNIPVPMTPFVGRIAEVDQLTDLLTNGDSRLVTLHGAGGNGKTRLAIRAASGLVEAGTDQFPDGIWFVPLAPLSSPDAIPQTIIKTLGHTAFDRDVESIQQLAGYLKERKLLLVLDNFENLITTESIRVITEINVRAPQVKLLVTSRSRLNIYGEQLFPITGMQTPQAEVSANKLNWENFSAMQLFRQCARRVQPTFEIEERNLLSVSQICQLVEGMPLGIELAAAWIEFLSLKEIAERIKQSLDILETDQAGVPERQRSIRAVFASSWELLTDEEQQAFLRLCVVIGSFTHEAAQKITGTSLSVLLGLANKSWLQQVGDGKFQLHELMRQFGEEHLKADLNAWQTAKDKHAEYYADFVAEQSLIMRSADQITGLIAIDEEFDLNIKFAWDWMVSNDLWNDIVQKMVLGLYHYVTIVKRLDDLVLLLKDARLKLLASDMNETNRLTLAIIDTLEIYCEEEFSILDDNPLERLKETWKFVTDHRLAGVLGFWYVMLAGLAYKKNIDPNAKKRLDEAITQIRESGDSWILGISLMIQANWWLEFNLDKPKLEEASQIFDDLGVPYEQSYIAGMMTDHVVQNQTTPMEIKDYFEKAQLFYRKLVELNPRFNYLSYRYNPPNRYFQIGEFETGFTAFHNEQKFFEQTGHAGWLAHSLYLESETAVRYSTFDHALRTRQRCLELSKLSEFQTTVFWNMYEYGEVYRVFGDQKKAMELYEQAFVGFEKLSISLGLAYYQRAYGDIALQNIQYSNALTHYQKFMKFSTEDNHLWSMAQAHGKLALAYAQLREVERSRTKLITALTQMQTWEKHGLILDSLLAEAACLMKDGRNKEAVALSSFLCNHLFSWNQTKQYARFLLDEVSSQLSPKDVESAKKSGDKIVLDDYIKNYIQTNNS